MENRFFKNQNILAFALIFIFALFYLNFTFGLSILNPTNIAWQFKHGDPASHYLGWTFFKNDVWHFPLGAMDNFNLAHRVSIGLTDSLPLLAILFKIFAPILPDDFQYFGFYILISLFLNGVFGYLLIRHFHSNFILALLCAAFFILSPPLLYRLNMHVALSSHWVILCALLFYFKNAPFKFWLILLSLVSMIHPYLLAMTLALFIFKLLFLKENLKIKIAYLFAAFVLTLFFTFLSGYFVSGGSLADSGFGLFQMNLLSFLDNNFIESTYSNYFPILLPQPADFIEDGTQYLGAGMILLAAIALYIYLRNFKKPKNILGENSKGLWFVLIFMAIFALASPVRFEYKELFTIALYDYFPFQEIAGIFRASGRFGWPLFYVVNLIILLTIIQKTHQIFAAIVLILALYLQIADLEPKYRAVYAKNQNAPQIVVNKEWENAFQNAEKLIMITHSMPHKLENGTFSPDLAFYSYAAFYPAYLAAKYKIPTNYAHNARSEFQKIFDFREKHLKLLKRGNPEKNTLYIFLPDITENDIKDFPDSLKTRLNFQNGYILLPPFENE